MVQAITPIEVSSRQKRLAIFLYIAVFAGAIFSTIHLGPTPLGGLMLILAPLCALAAFRGVSLSIILTFLTLGASAGVLLNVGLGLRGPGVMSWIVLAPITASMFRLKRSILMVSTTVGATWLYLALTLPGSLPTHWSELRTHFLLILIVSGCIAWANSQQITQWQEDAHEIIRRFDVVIDLHPLPAIVLLDGKIVIFNEQAAQLLKTNVEDLIGKPIEEALPFEVDPASGLSLSELEIAGTIHTIEVRQRQLDLPSGKGAILVLSDRTEALEKQLEERQATRARQEAEQHELVGRLAGGVAHGFNNILATILLNIDLAEVALDNGSADLFRKSHAEIRTAAEFARDQVTKLLAYSGRGPVITEVVDVSSSMASTVELLESLAQSSSVHLSFSAESSKFVEADPIHIGQLLMNITSNAIEACDPGGHVEVSIHDVYLGVDDVEGLLTPLLEEGHFLEIRVRDDGVGIPPEQMEHLCQPYFTTRVFGTGLGLAAVRGIIDAQRGALAVTSRVGHGSLFRAFIPSASSAQIDHPRDSEHARIKILVVDDDPLVLSVVNSVLNRAGYRTDTAETVAEARSILETDDSISGVLADYGLPDGSGLDLKEHPAGDKSSLPFVLMSSYRVQDIEDLGDVRLLSKPFTISDVLGALESELEAQRLQVASAALE